MSSIRVLNILLVLFTCCIAVAGNTTDVVDYCVDEDVECLNVLDEGLHSSLKNARNLYPVSVKGRFFRNANTRLFLFNNVSDYSVVINKQRLLCIYRE